MKKLLVGILFLSILCGCQVFKIVGSDVISSTVGINRTITLYSVDGTIIKQYKTMNGIDTTDGVCSFMCDNKKVLISGTFVVEELK